MNINNTKDLNVTITNGGTNNLNISSLSIISGTGFSIVSGGGSGSLATCGTSRNVVVRFAPTAATIYSGSIALEHNVSGSPSTINLLGTGVAPFITINPNPIDFGNVTVDNPLQQSVRITNSGNVDLVISSIAINGTGFTLPNGETSKTINAGSYYDLAVRFAPTATINYLGIITLTHNASGSPSTINLLGTGVSAQGPNIIINPNPVAFGDVDIGSSSQQFIRITNSGSADLVISSIAINGTGFTLPNGETSKTINAGNSSYYDLSVRFVPTATTNYLGIITLTHNASGSPTTINLTGTGVSSPAPGFTIDPTSINFADVEVGIYKEIPIRIQNTGNANLRITALSITGEHASDFSLVYEIGSIGIEIAPLSIYNNAVRFRPNVIGQKTASLQIVSDTYTATINLSGTGTIQTSVEEPTYVENSNSTFLFQNNPNPVRSGYDVSISYRLNDAGQVNLNIYDVLGREVAKLVDEYKPQGKYSANFNTRNLPSGVYFYKLKTAGYEGLKKMLIIR